MSPELKALNDLAYEDLKKRFTILPVHALPKPKYSDKTANKLTSAIVDFINLKGGFAERISNTGRYIEGASIVDTVGRVRNFKGKYIPGTGKNGTADISATYQGLSLKIEVKIGHDKMSEAQKEYQERTIAAGGIYFIARDFPSFYHFFIELQSKTT